ncbi:MAG TPA: hypothetical protein VI731_09195 [Bacteroidia bacterium]|nr:hypothetical protein [Bacteroidia bacterium]
MTPIAKYLRLRYTAFAVVLLTILFNSLYRFFPAELLSPEEILGRFAGPVIPASFVFKLNWLINFCLLVYATCQVLPWQRHKPVYDELALPLIISGILSTCYTVVFSLGSFGLAAIIQLAWLFSTIILFLRAKSGIRWGDPPVFQIPFGLYLGWTAYLSIISLSTWLVASKINSDLIFQDGNTIAWLAAMLVGCIVFSLLLKDWLFTLVFAWVFAGIYVENQVLHRDVALFALVIAVFLFCWSLSWLIIRYYRRNARIEQPNMYF